MSAESKRLASKIALYGLLTVSAVIVLVPLGWLLSTAFKNDTEVFTTPPRWIPEEPTFEAFIRIWTDYPFLQYFQNSIVAVGLSTLIAVSFAALAGYGIARFKFPGRGTFLTFLLVTQMFPSIMLLIPYYHIIQQLGLVNTVTSLVITYSSFTIPLCTWMMYGYFQGIPKDLDEAASIDGLGRVRTFLYVVLPLALPGLAATAIYAFIMGWNEYVFALVLTQSEEVRTVAVGIGHLVGQYRILWNDLMAASIYALAPMLLIFGFLQRHLITGLTAGAVKG